MYTHRTIDKSYEEFSRFSYVFHFFFYLFLLYTGVGVHMLTFFSSIFIYFFLFILQMMRISTLLGFYLSGLLDIAAVSINKDNQVYILEYRKQGTEISFLFFFFFYIYICTLFLLLFYIFFFAHFRLFIFVIVVKLHL